MDARTYLLGLPVSVTVNDDGTVRIEVYLEDVSEGIRDEAGAQYGDEDSVAALTMEQCDADAATFEQTLTIAQLVSWKRDRITVAWS